MHVQRKLLNFLKSALKDHILLGVPVYSTNLFDVYRDEDFRKHLKFRMQYLDPDRSQDMEAGDFFLLNEFIRSLSSFPNSEALIVLLQMYRDLMLPHIIEELPLCTSIYYLYRGLYLLVSFRAYFHFGNTYNITNNLISNETYCALTQLIFGSLLFFIKCRRDFPSEIPMLHLLNTYFVGILV